MTATEFEKLGSFYLGRVYDLERNARSDATVLYDSKDLVTHAVCVGMTGSGKTGLCIGILEEAAIDGIPSIVIDPKGDLSNLLLTFPELRAEDFRPWVNEDDAKRKGLDTAAYAKQQAEMWAKGLADWGQDGARIAKLKQSADFAVYTPGSGAGLPVSVLRSFDAPDESLVEDAELFRERIGTTVTSLLGLMGVVADPLRSREHILLSTIFAQAWENGEGLDLPTLIQRIQSPGVTRVGVMELETFFPAAERFELAMQLNNLVASPGFSRWMEGEPLDIGAMLATPEGRPRVSIFSIAHLNDAERMFFVSLLLNQTLGWVRSQTGTTSLRALLYMDEIAGYFPPVANPPSKQPLLTLMKQARAFGLGVVLATQNPVDLDYKGLSNAGTWFIGRLQTERDKARVLDGLEGAAASASARFDRAAMDAALSRLGTRVFLMNNVHEDSPEVFETRWCLSYLRGPLTRDQIRVLMAPRKAAAGRPAEGEVSGSAAGPSGSAPAAAAPRSANGSAPESTAQKPVLPPEIPQYFIPVRAGAAGPGARIVYRPMVLGSAKLYYSDARSGVDSEETVCYLAGLASGPVAVDWDHAEVTGFGERELAGEPVPGASFAALPTDAGKARSYETWKKSFAEMVGRLRTLDLWRNAEFKLVSKPGESERDFRQRVAQAAREARDALVDKLRSKYAPKVAVLQDRLRRAEQAVAVQKEQAMASKAQTAISFGAAVLSAFMGRKTFSAGTIGRATTAAKGVGRSAKEASDVGRAQENAAAVRQQLEALESEFQAEVAASSGPVDPAAIDLDEVSIRPKRNGVSVRAVVLAWAPQAVDAGGRSVAAWK